MHPTPVATQSHGSPRRSVVARLVSAGLAFTALLVTGVASGADDTDRMRDAQRALEKTVGLYDRVYAKWHCEAKSTSGPITTTDYEWWEDGGKIRAKETRITNPPLLHLPSKISCDYAVRNGVFTTITRKRVDDADEEYATIQSGGREKFIGDSVWCAALLTGRDSPPRMLWKEFWALDTYEHRPAPALPGFDGPGIESPRKQDPPHTQVVYLDPAHDYLPRKLLNYQYPGPFDPNKRYVELEVLEYFTRADGLPSAFPKKTRLRAYGEGGASAPPTIETTRTFSAVRVPDPIPAATFQLKIPVGYTVADYITGKQYILGPDGGPAPGTEVKKIPAGHGR
jgi:hypothetical protein